MDSFTGNHPYQVFPHICNIVLTMEKILEYVHHTEIPLLHYNSETELELSRKAQGISAVLYLSDSFFWRRIYL